MYGFGLFGLFSYVFLLEIIDNILEPTPKDASYVPKPYFICIHYLVHIVRFTEANR